MMPRREVLAQVKRLVVKVGTAVLSTPDGCLDAARVAGLAEQVDAAVRSGYEVVLVTSGAIGAGMGQLGLRERPTALPQLQAAAAVGQSYLMAAYDQSFKQHGHHAAQILLTRETFDDRARYLNVRNALTAMFGMGVVPVVNENDTVSVDEITFGDNDLLSALLASMIGADVLILLSKVAGLLNAERSVVSEVPRVTDELIALDFGTRTDRGKGGLLTKLDAVRRVTEAGYAAVIACGDEPDVIRRILEGEDVGTFFVPQPHRTRSRKRWFAARTTRGTLAVDAGARRALVERGKSLLPSGIVAVRGTFDRGDTVAIAGPDGEVFATGLTNLSSADLGRICGKRSSQVCRLLGDGAYQEAIHRDNMLVRSLGDERRRR
jgi:glutamate 5-kinase